MRLCAIFAIVFLAVTLTASATSISIPKPNYGLEMDYSISPAAGGGRYVYDFTLENRGFASGSSFGWLIFGDAKIWGEDSYLQPEYGVGAFGQGSSPWMPDFQMTSPVPGPWTYLSSSGGYHNGPTFGFVLDTRVINPGESISWSGTSETYLGQGELLWSSLVVKGANGGSIPAIEFAVANMSSPIPEPGTYALVLPFGF